MFGIVKLKKKWYMLFNIDFEGSEVQGNQVCQEGEQITVGRVWVVKVSTTLDVCKARQLQEIHNLL